MFKNKYNVWVAVVCAIIGAVLNLFTFLPFIIWTFLLSTLGAVCMAGDNIFNYWINNHFLASFLSRVVYLLILLILGQFLRGKSIRWFISSILILNVVTMVIFSYLFLTPLSDFLK
jgi:uncharacterized Tic20 family protein